MPRVYCGGASLCSPPSSGIGFLRSILAQLLKKQRTLAPHALPRNWHSADILADLTKESFWTPTKLQQALTKLSHAKDLVVHICLFIDGLDEIEGDLEDLAKFCLGLIQRSEKKESPFKACIASRPLPVLTQAFMDFPSLRLQDFTRNDIELYVSDSLKSYNSLELSASYNEPEAQWLVRGIVQKASGVFPWVTVVCKSLREGLRDGDTLEELQAKLSRLSPDLEDLLKHTSITVESDHKQQAAQIFEISRFAREPPNLLQLALAIDGPEAALGRSEEALPRSTLLRQMQVLWRRLQSRCVGLSEFEFEFDIESLEEQDEETFEFYTYDQEAQLQFIHGTVRELSESHCPWELLGVDRPTEFDANIALLSRVCSSLELSHASEVYEAGQRVWRDPTWGIAFYICTAEASSNRSQSAFIEELNRIEQTRQSPRLTRLNTRKIHWSGIICEPGQEGRDYQPCDYLVSFAVVMGFESYVREEISDGSYKATLKRPLLHFAVSPYHDSDRVRAIYPGMVQFLLEHGSDTNLEYEGRSAWQIVLNNLAVKTEEMDFSNVERISRREKKTTWPKELRLFVLHHADPNVPVLHVKEKFDKKGEHHGPFPLDIITEVYEEDLGEDVGFVLETLASRGGMFRTGIFRLKKS